MKSLTHHINTVKAKPHHVRKQVALAAAFITAVIIGVIWVGASLATGAFALKESNFAESTGQTGSVAAQDSSNTDLTASAANASAFANTPAGIEIVDAPAAAPSAAKSQATVIPF